METALVYSPVRQWVIASGLVHLSLIAFFVLGPKFQLQTEQRQILEVSFLTPKAAPGAEVQSPPPVRVRRPIAPAQPVLQEAPSPQQSAAKSPAETAPDVLNPSVTAITTASADAASVEVLNAYEMEVASRLNALKRYPDAAKRMRQQGRVMVRFKLDRDGHVLVREIVEPSPHATLNEAARSLLSQIQEFKPFPAQSTVTSWVFTVPIEYRL